MMTLYLKTDKRPDRVESLFVYKKGAGLWEGKSTGKRQQPHPEISGYKLSMTNGNTTPIPSIGINAY